MQKAVMILGLVSMCGVYDLSAALARRTPPIAVNIRHVSGISPCVSNNGEDRVLSYCYPPSSDPYLCVAKGIPGVHKQGGHFGDNAIRHTNFGVLGILTQSRSKQLATTAQYILKVINTKRIYAEAKFEFERTIIGNIPCRYAPLEKKKNYRFLLDELGLLVGKSIKSDIDSWVPRFIDQKKIVMGNEYGTTGDASVLVRLIVAMRLSDDCAPVFGFYFGTFSDDMRLSFYACNVIEKDIIMCVQGDQMNTLQKLSVKANFVKNMEQTTRDVAQLYLTGAHHSDVINPSVLLAYRARLVNSLIMPKEGAKENPCSMSVTQAVDAWWQLWKYRNGKLESQQPKE